MTINGQSISQEWLAYSSSTVSLGKIGREPVKEGTPSLMYLGAFWAEELVSRIPIRRTFLLSRPFIAGRRGVADLCALKALCGTLAFSGLQCLRLIG
jgi:hypothetical protein